MKQLTYFILLIILLSSCGTIDRANRKLKKAERLTEAAIQLGAKVNRDTVFITKEVIIPQVKTDTVVELVGFNLQDTIFIERERLKVKVKLDTMFREIFVEAQCKPDTITIEVPVSIDTDIKAGKSVWDMVIACIVAAIVGGSVMFVVVFRIKSDQSET